MILLHIETSTHVCSVALTEGETILFQKQNREGMNHAALLSIFIDEALNLLKIEVKKLDAVVVSGGPGSYTGLRIGASTAKGLCYGFDIPLLSVSTLEIMTIDAIKQTTALNPDDLFIPMIDARRMEVYDAVFGSDLRLIRDINAEIITEIFFENWNNSGKVYFFGNGAEKCRPFINNLKFHFIPDIHPLAENMIIPAMKKFKAGIFEDVAYFEPFYLKEFFTTAKKLI